jgi:hypothetical protein
MVHKGHDNKLVVYHFNFYALITAHAKEFKKIYSWDRCYDFLNILAQKFGEKIGVFG